MIPILLHTIEVIEAFFTGCPRLHLYSYLDIPQEKAMDCDNDSVFYEQRDTEPALIRCGDNFDDTVSELKPANR
jgi:hypothetical protein